MNGRRFGRLVVQASDPSHKHKVTCACDCGETVSVWRSSLYGGNTQSCGCLQRERTVQANAARLKHGLSYTRELGVWRAMIQRCTDPDCNSYDSYGGRGIKVCDRWLRSVEAFVADMESRPPGSQLDRIDNEGHYEPSNCRWVSRQENMMNRRNTLLITCDGITQSASEWAAQTGIKKATIYARKKAGWSDERTLKEKVSNV